MKIEGVWESSPSMPCQTVSGGGTKNPVITRAAILPPWREQGASEAATLRSQPEIRRPASSSRL